MSDLFGALKELPAAAAAAAVIYGLVYYVLRKRRVRPRWFIILAEYVLVGWMLLFIFVTQLMQFGNGMGEWFNLVPFRPFYTAWNYGLVNAESLSQVGLNIVITVPLGFLLPIVFPHRYRRFVSVLLVGLALSVSTELSQLVTMRNADIDDVISNTLGVVVGFVLYVLARAVVDWRWRQSSRPAADVRQHPVRLIGAVAIIAVVCAPFVAVVAKNNQDPVGHVYYGHMLPAEVEVTGAVSTEGATSAVYRNVQRESTADLIARLRAYAGFPDDCSLTGGTWACSNGKSERLFVYSYNRWSVLYDAGQGAAVANEVPDEAAAIGLAEDALRTFDIDPGTLAYSGLDTNWGDAYKHLVFTQRTQSKDSMVWGDVTVTIGENGAVVEVSDARTYNSLSERVRTISPRESVRIAGDVGAGRMAGKVDVTGVEPSFWFNEDSGYLIPTWQVNPASKSDLGQELSWMPNIDARG